MYDPKHMKKRLDDAVFTIKEQLRNELKDSFHKIYVDDNVPEKLPLSLQKISRLALKDFADLDKVFSGSGFYIILSNYQIDGNLCRLRRGELKAIYRGECFTTKERIKSHLFNSRYNSDFDAARHNYESFPANAGKRFHKAHWPHCLKLQANGPSGIDTDSAPYNEYQWEVIIHQMKESSQDIRKLAEEAFDLAFGHPVASREPKKRL